MRCIAAKWENTIVETSAYDAKRGRVAKGQYGQEAKFGSGGELVLKGQNTPPPAKPPPPQGEEGTGPVNLTFPICSNIGKL
eukprot:6200926-Pleurochrysis_carterae.AAC.4